MLRTTAICLLALLPLLALIVVAQEAKVAIPDVAWGKIHPGPSGTGLFALEISTWPEDGRLHLPVPFANITRAYLLDDPLRKPVTIESDAQGKVLVVHLPQKELDPRTQVQLETADSATQFANGRIVLTAGDARVSYDGGSWNKPPAEEVTHQGQQAVLLKHAKIASVAWEYIATRPGMYDVEVMYASTGSPDAQIVFTKLHKLDATKISTPRRGTNSLDEFTAEKVGKVYIPEAGEIGFALICKTKQGGQVPIRVKSVTLRPTSEGAIPEQAEDGTITCHARDVTIQGVKVQYEPKPEKNTVGYWVNEKDWVYWDFTVNKAGTYVVEILQGCGKGHGGSEVNLSIAGQTLPFTVEDTGHFQNFKPRTIGQVKLDSGQQRLAVVPVKKANVAIMDLRQVKLIPVPE